MSEEFEACGSFVRTKRDGELVGQAIASIASETIGKVEKGQV